MPRRSPALYQSLQALHLGDVRDLQASVNALQGDVRDLAGQLGPLEERVTALERART